jgi:hypothetical protein
MTFWGKVDYNIGIPVASAAKSTADNNIQSLVQTLQESLLREIEQAINESIANGWYCIRYNPGIKIMAYGDQVHVGVRKMLEEKLTCLGYKITNTFNDTVGFILTIDWESQ